MQFLSCLDPSASSLPQDRTRVLAAFQHGSNTLNLFGSFSRLYPATEPSQRFPARVAWTHITGTFLAVAILTAARAESFAVRLAQRPDRRGQSTLRAAHPQAKTVDNNRFPSPAVLWAAPYRVRHNRLKIGSKSTPAESPPAQRTSRDLKPPCRLPLRRISATMSFGPRCSCNTSAKPEVARSCSASSPNRPHPEPAPGQIRSAPLQFTDIEFHKYQPTALPPPVNWLPILNLGRPLSCQRGRCCENNQALAKRPDLPLSKVVDIG